MNKNINEKTTIERITRETEEMVDNQDLESILKNINKFTGKHKAILQLLLFDNIIYNYGHQIYYEDGYACGGLIYTEPGEDNYKFHNDLLCSMIDNFEDVEEFDPIIDILEQFKIEIDYNSELSEECFSCNGLGLIIDHMDDTGELIENICGTCGGSGFVDIENDNIGEIANGLELNDLDRQYMSIRNELLAEIVKVVNNGY